MERGVRGGHRHPTNRIGRCRRRRLRSRFPDGPRRGTPSPGHDVGEYRQGHFLGRRGADVQPGGRDDASLEVIGDVEIGDDGCTALRAGHQADVVDTAGECSSEHAGLVPAVRRHDHGSGIGRRLGGADDLVSDSRADGGESVGDRAVPTHGDERRRPLRLEEDLQRAAAEAGIVGHQLAGHRLLRRRADSQHDGLAGVEQGERLRSHRRLGAVAANEPLDRPIGEDDRLVAGMSAGRPLRQHDSGVDEWHPLPSQLLCSFS